MGEGFAEFAGRGAFMDVGDRLERDVDTSDFLPQALRWYRMIGSQLGVPFLMDVQFVAYNKKAFDEAGPAYPRMAGLVIMLVSGIQLGAVKG